jgi:hypothetical protein
MTCAGPSAGCVTVPGIAKRVQLTSTAAGQIQQLLQFATSILSDASVYGKDSKQEVESNNNRVNTRFIVPSCIVFFFGSVVQWLWSQN